MMFRFFKVTAAALIVIWALLAAGATWLGSYADTQIVTTVANHNTRRFDSRLMVRLVDMKRIVSASLLPRTEHRISSMLLDGPHHAFLLTQETVNARGRTSTSLYYADLFERDAVLKPIFTFPNILRQDVFQVNGLSPQWSPDRSRLAFYHPIDGQVYVYDTRTQETLVVSDGSVDGVFRQTLTWSPDSQQIALRDTANSLFVVNADGSSKRHYDLPETQTFEPVWSQDNQNILISHFNQSDTPILVLDAATMQPDPEIATVMGNYPRWCDDGWIIFFRMQSDYLRTPHVLDTGSGAVLDLAEDSRIAQNTLRSMVFDSNCEHLLVLRPSLPPLFYALFVSDMTGGDLQLVHDRVRIYSEQDGEIIFFTTSGDDSYEVIRTSIDDSAHQERIARFRPASYFSPSGFQAGWNPNTPHGLLYVPGILYRIDRQGLRRISTFNDDVLQYEGWPGT